MTAGTDVTALENLLAPWKNYLLENTPSPPQLINLNQDKYTLIAEWFRPFFTENSELPPPGVGDNHNRKDFFPRISAKNRSVKNEDDAKKLAEEYRKIPILPLNHIIINI